MPSRIRCMRTSPPAAFRRGFPDVTLAAVKPQAFVANGDAALVIVHGARYTSPYTSTECQGVIILVDRRGQSAGAMATAFPGFSRVPSQRKAEHWSWAGV